MTLPLWLILSLISPVFWALVHVLDSYCVNRVFDKPWMGIVASAATMLCTLPILLAGICFTGWTPFSPETLLLCLLAGCAFMASQVAYFYALSYSESGIVAAYWNLLPLFLLVIGYLFLDERFTVARYAGCLVLVICSVSFCLVDSNLRHRARSFWLMVAGAWLQVIYFLLLKYIFNKNVVFPTCLAVTLGMILAGFTPLLLRSCRKVFRHNVPKILPQFPFLLAIEAANITAVITSQYAIHYGAPSLVASVEAAIPAYTFLTSLILYAVSSRFGEEQARHRLCVKVTLVGFMIFGVYLLS